MGNGFQAKAKQAGVGTCKEHSHDKDADIYMQNKGDDVNKNWVICRDLECFTKQGGVFDPNAPKKQFNARTKEQRLDEAAVVIPILWQMSVKFATENHLASPLEVFKEYVAVFCR